MSSDQQAHMASVRSASEAANKGEPSNDQVNSGAATPGGSGAGLMPNPITGEGSELLGFAAASSLNSMSQFKKGPLNLEQLGGNSNVFDDISSGNMSMANISRDPVNVPGIEKSVSLSELGFAKQTGMAGAQH